MANRFCASCGAKLMTGASFCVECGERQPGAKAPRAGFSIPIQRFAPLFVILTVVAAGAGAVLYGLATPKTPPTVPGRGLPPAAGGAASGKLPEGHPPVAIPDQVKSAIRDLEGKAQAAPDDMEAWKRLGEVQYRAGQVDASFLPAAAATFKHIVEKEPDNLEAIRALGNIAFDQEQQDIAVGYYQEYLKRKPDDLNVKTDLGTMYLSADKPQQAIAVYDAVLNTDPKFFQAQFNLAIAYRQLGQTDKAIEALEKSRPLAPDDKTRGQVDQLLARAKDQPVPEENAVAAAAPPPQAAVGGTFQADAEAIFRQNQIMGPKVQRIEWPGAESAKVYLRDFPMDQMPPEMLTMFTDRMKGRIKEKKDTYKVTAATRFDLIDDATGKLMGTIAE